MTEARVVCEYIEGRETRDAFVERFAEKMSPGFDPDRDLERVGVANQTTMLSGESLAIAAEIGKSMARRWGEAAIGDHFRTFDTICSATQERQDAVLKLIAEPLDLMVVIGGWKTTQTTPPPAHFPPRGAAHPNSHRDCLHSRAGRGLLPPPGGNQGKEPA